MRRLPVYDWLWVVWAAIFAVLEGIGIIHNAQGYSGDWTLTHFVSVIIPVGLRAGFLAWLAWHFLVEHKSS